MGKTSNNATIAQSTDKIGQSYNPQGTKMIGSLLLLSPLILIFLGSTTEFKNPQLKAIQSYIFWNKSRQLTPERQFRLYMMQGNYQSCIELLQNYTPQLTVHDYDTIQTLERLESNESRKQDATACKFFLHHYLVDQGIITNQRVTRPLERELMQVITEQNAQLIAAELRSSKGQFFKSIENNDTIAMRQHLTSDITLANSPFNQLLPVEFAIARHRKDALDLLYRCGVTPTQQHLEAAQTFKYLITSNQNNHEPDFVFTKSSHADGFNEAITQTTEIVDFIQTQLNKKQPNRATTKSGVQK